MSIKLIGDKNSIAQEISDDDNGDNEEGDEIEDKTLSFTESLKMLDKINKCSFLDEVIKSTVTKKLENLQHQNKKQKSITSYFSRFQSIKISMLLTFNFCFEVVAFDLLFLK